MQTAVVLGVADPAIEREVLAHQLVREEGNQAAAAEKIRRRRRRTGGAQPEVNL